MSLTPIKRKLTPEEEYEARALLCNAQALLLGLRHGHKLTRAEYMAQAMLLGLYYGPLSHTFINEGDNTYLDADTLEPMPREVYLARYHGGNDAT